MISAGVITGARVTHESGSVDELAAASPESQVTGVTELLSVPAIEEAYVISTCNRVEAYVVADDAAVGHAALAEFFAAVDDDSVVMTDHDASLRQLLSVAAGLESVVLGEDQILGQVRTAYEDARSAGGIDEMLEAAVTKAIHVGERARTETAINDGIVSLGSAATQLAARDCSLEGTHALVIGAGEMGRLAARNLAAAGVSKISIANRTVEHAEDIAASLETTASAVSLSAVGTVLPDVTVVITATGSNDPVLEASHLGADGTVTVDSPTGNPSETTTTEHVIVDLGQPRDVSPVAGSLPTVTVYDLDDLESVTAETRDQRADAALEVESMIDHEFDLLCEQYKRARADEAIAVMYESAERMKKRELETALSRLEGEEFSPEQREIVESMADALVNQLLAPPTKSLRDAAAEDDWSTINTALQLFDPEFGRDDGSISPPTNTEPIATETQLEATDDD